MFGRLGRPAVCGFNLGDKVRLVFLVLFGHAMLLRAHVAPSLAQQRSGSHRTVNCPTTLVHHNVDTLGLNWDYHHPLPPENVVLLTHELLASGDVGEPMLVCPLKRCGVRCIHDARDI